MITVWVSGKLNGVSTSCPSESIYTTSTSSVHPSYSTKKYKIILPSTFEKTPLQTSTNLTKMATYLITQATGGQALWTIDFLLNAGAKIHALVRDPSKVPAELLRPGITIFDRENDSLAALLKAARGTKGVFLNTPETGSSNLKANKPALFSKPPKKLVLSQSWCRLLSSLATRRYGIPQKPSSWWAAITNPKKFLRMW